MQIILGIIRTGRKIFLFIFYIKIISQRYSPSSILGIPNNYKNIKASCFVVVQLKHIRTGSQVSSRDRRLRPYNWLSRSVNRSSPRQKLWSFEVRTKVEFKRKFQYSKVYVSLECRANFLDIRHSLSPHVKVIFMCRITIESVPSTLHLVISWFSQLKMLYKYSDLKNACFLREYDK